MANTHRVLLVTGGENHDFPKSADLITNALASAGIGVAATTDPAALRNLAADNYDCVVLFAMHDRFDDAGIEALTQFVRNGGGLVALHATLSSAKSSDAFGNLLGARIKEGKLIDFKLSVSDAAHPIAHRVQEFRLDDELYVLDFKSDVTPFLSAHWGGKLETQAYSKSEGEGRIVYLGPGHRVSTFAHPTFQKLIARSVRYAAGEDWSQKTVKVAAIGYGGAFNMGKLHLQSCEKAGMKPVAVCDVDAKRTATAKQELGEHVQAYQQIPDLLAKSDAEMCVIITPHNLHAAQSIQCLEAGRHVVTEKPYTITVDEATRVIETARRMNKMATVFHNRRWDGDFLAIKNIIASGVIGDVFHIECGFGGYSEPRTDWWRSYKDVSGGAFYDWGAHFVDWVLNLLPYKIQSIAGDFKKLKWHQVSNEDYTSAYVRFEGNRSASIEQSSLAALGRSRWRILGTNGAIEQKTGDAKAGLHVVTFRDGTRWESTYPIGPSDWDAFYRNIADHLILGEPLAVTAESARKVIAVISLSEQSAKQGGVPVAVPFEQ